MGASARQGLLPFRMEAAARPMDLTAPAGRTRVAETLAALGAEDLVRAELRLGPRRRGFGPYAKLQWLVLLRAAGGGRVEDVRVLGRDAGLGRLLRRGTPSPDARHDFLGAVHAAPRMQERPDDGAWIPGESAALEALHRINVEWVARRGADPAPPQATLDLDAPLIERRPRAARAHDQGGRGAPPVAVGWAEADLVVADPYRDGNVPAGRRTLEVVERALAALPATVRERRFRGDRACYEEALPKRLWRAGVGFTISADMTRELRAGCSAPGVAWEPLEARATARVHVAEVEFTPGVWPKDAPPMRYVAVRFTGQQGRLFAEGTATQYLAAVSNRAALPAAARLRWHGQKSGTIEHVHDLTKNERGAGIVPSQKFGANAAWYRINLMTYHVLTALKRHALPERLREAEPRRLRYEGFAMAAEIHAHARELIGPPRGAAVDGGRAGRESRTTAGAEHAPPAAGGAEPPGARLARGMRGRVRTGINRAPGSNHTEWRGPRLEIRPADGRRRTREGPAGETPTAS